MAKCRVCGQEVVRGVVVHPECLPRWRPAKELPDEGETVFVIVNGRFENIIFEDALEFAYYTCVEGWVLENYLDWDEPHIRCWMPTTDLPEPPRDM